MAPRKITPESEVQPVAPGLDDLPAAEPDAELEVQPAAEPDAELEVQPAAEPDAAELEKPRDALEYIREQWGEG